MIKETWAMVPVKDFAKAKSRLAGQLTAGQRREVARLMATDVLRALTQCPLLDGVTVMGQGPDQAQLAARFGCEFVPDVAGEALSHNLTRVSRQLAERGVRTLLVVPADLPDLRVDDIERVLRQHRCGVTICRAGRDGGTN
ncbi:MAG: NTP transferase domain-containing protein, partial [Gammaproteobacteria bacterium]